MTVDYGLLIQRQASQIMLRAMLGDLASGCTPAELQAGADGLYKTLLEVPIEAEGCYCKVLPPDRICPLCFDEAAGIEK